MPSTYLRATALLTTIALTLPSCSEPKCGDGELQVADTCIKPIKRDAGSACDGADCDADDGEALDAQARDASAAARDGASRISDAAKDADIDASREPRPPAPSPAATDGSAPGPHSRDAWSGELQDAGTKNNCPPQACDPGGTCMSAFDDWTCSCGPGFTGTGGRVCLDIDECALLTDCGDILSHPCRNTPGSYTCLGRFADWPMPENGSKNKPRYAGDSDTFTDEITGLQWQKELPATYAGCTGTGADWEQGVSDDGPPGTTCTQQQARSYCSGLQLAGLTWRLPSAIELLSLVRAAELSGQPLTRPYWSIDRAGDLGRLVQNAGAVRSEVPTARAYVRCVRGLGKNADKPHYTVAADGATVRDNRTELTWERKPQNRDSSYADAKAYCEMSGRRLPTAKELMTLYDSERIAGASSPSGDPARDLSAFPSEDLPQACYWSSTDLAVTIPELPADMSYVTICEPDGAFSGASKMTAPERTRVRCVL